MLETLLNIGCAFDWITPTVASVQDFFSGPVSDFGIPSNIGWDREDIKRLLTKHGVHVWGLMYNLNGEMLMFTVRKPQAKWAFYILQREGIPVLYAPTEVVNSSDSSLQSNLKKTNVTDPFETILNFLDNLDKDF